MTKKHLYTIGYEGQTLDSFFEQLSSASVRLLVDVRELPLSRKRGFSKRGLASALAEIGIAYAHMPALGCPKPIRDRLKSGGDWQSYAQAFGEHLAKQDASIDELAQLAGGTTACLLCFEANFNRCHRTLVGRAAVAAGAPPLAHITPERVIPELALRRTA